MASRRVTIEFLGDDKSLSKTARSVDTTTSKLGDTFKRVGKTAAIGLGVGVAAAGAALVAFGKGAVAEAREAQKIGAQTEAVIKSTGGAANVTAAQVGKLAEALSYKAGIDDEVIQSGSNVLLTFKNIRNEVGKGNDIFNQATGVALDMSVALGQDMKSASILVGKALNDPIAGLSALSRVGVSFTEKQKKVIEGLVKSGDTMKAQKLILKELNSEFKGSAEAQATAGDKARVAWGNFQEQIGMKLLPLMDKLAVFFVEVIIPALQRFSAWFQREGIPVLKRFGAFVREVFARVVAWVKENWPEIRKTIDETLKTIVTNWRNFADIVITIWRKWGDDIFRVLEPILKGIIVQIRAVMKILRGVINVVTGLIKGDWSQVWKGIKEIFGGAWDAMKNQLKVQLKVLRALITSAWDAVKDIFKHAWDGIKELFGRAWDGIKNLAKNGLDFLRDRFMDYVGIYRKAFTAYFDIWRTIWGKVWDFAKTIWSKIRGTFDAGVKGIGRIWDKLKGIATRPVNFVIKWVINKGLIRAINALPFIDDISDVPLIGLRKGGYTGNKGRNQVAGLVHGREFVINAESTERIMRTNPGFLEQLNKSGMPGHRAGGFINPMSRVYVDGEPVTAVHAAQLALAGSLMGARQHVIQGSWQAASSYSGTSHTGPGVADTSPGSFRAQWAQRRTGIAAWARNIPGAAYAGSGAHVHGVSLFSAPGNSQAAAYRAGGDGLGGRDYGPRPGLMPGLFDKLKRFKGLMLSGIGLINMPDVSDFVGDVQPGFLDALKNIWDKIHQMTESGWPGMLRGMAGNLVSSAKNWGVDAIKDAAKAAIEKPTEWWRDWASGFQPPIPGLADGGIVTKPTVALIGEKGPEAVIPLKELKSRKHKAGFEKAGGDFIRAVDRGLMSEKELRRLMAHADKIVERLKNRLSTAMDKLRSSLEARKSVVQSVTGGFTTSIFGASGADGNPLRTAGAILSFAQTQRDQARRVTAAIRKLVKKGLSKSLIRQMLAAGESGQAQLMALANQADPAQIDILNRFNEQRLDALHAGGMAAGNALFGDQIRRRRHNVADLRRDLRRAERRADRLHDVIKVDVFIDGKQIEQSQVRLKRRNGGRLAYL